MMYIRIPKWKNLKHITGGEAFRCFTHIKVAGMHIMYLTNKLLARH